MKRILLSIAVSAFIISCGNNSSKQTDPYEAQKKADEEWAAAHPELKKGKDLIAKYDCLTCHKEDVKLIGPAYKDVAQKYAGMSDTIVTHLASKVIAGGKGNWGEVPMAAHPAITKEDAETMVKYVLSLK